MSYVLFYDYIFHLCIPKSIMLLSSLWWHCSPLVYLHVILRSAPKSQTGFRIPKSYLTLTLNISKGWTITALVGSSLCALKVWQEWRKHSLIGHFLSEARTKVIIIPHYINWGQTETLPPQCLNQPEKRERSDTSTKHKSLGIPPFPWHYCVCVDAFCRGCNGREESSVRGWLCNLGVIAPSRPPSLLWACGTVWLWCLLRANRH